MTGVTINVGVALFRFGEERADLIGVGVLGVLMRTGVSITI